MPPPIKVEVVPYSEAWPGAARLEMERLVRSLGGVFCEVHVIGSTAVPGLAAKPILDLMPVTADIALVDAALPGLERLGYQGWGELGIPGRRYFTKDTADETRWVQLHCFSTGSPHVERHLAFRDYLRAHPGSASAYQDEKVRCSELYPGDSHAYADCKAAWIIRVEAEALRWYRNAARK